MDNINTLDNKNDYIFDIDEHSFQKKIIEASKSNIILVDFWAPWCEPCKQLSPVLENIVNDCEGRIHLAKINIDENQQIAVQLKIQSIPIVYAFKNQQIADAFQGVLPYKKIIEFVEKVLGEKIKKDNSAFYDEVKKLISNKQLKQAESLLEKFISENSKDVVAISMYLNCMIDLSKFLEANDFISALSPEILDTPEIKSVITNLQIKENSSVGPSLDKIKNIYEKNPKNLNNALILSEKYFANQMIENAFELLLNLYKNYKDKDRDKIKKILLKYFEALGNNNENTKYYRKKFSSIMFV
jgi:putative thioredoxin|tara:strand:- start:974 stop:1873 length:900 start_codon:yes stop_codon:yes gene_type:complete